MFASAQCSGTWSPSASSSYVLSWEVSDNGLSVEFNVSVTTSANTWVAVGFSATSSMVSSYNYKDCFKISAFGEIMNLQKHILYILIALT